MGMGFEGALVLASFLTITAPVKLDTRPSREQLPRLDDSALFGPRIDVARGVDAELALPAKQIELDAIELRDAMAEGDWARQVDFELAATHGPWSIALNHHFIVRNIGEAQVVVSFSVEY